jgi:formylglycine-generating enzyme required for sulfatase activity
MSTEQFVAALTEYQLDPTEIAEVLWLALRLPPLEADNDDTDGADEDNQSSGQTADVENDSNNPPAEDHPDQADQDDESDEEDRNSFGIAPELPSGILPQNSLPISVPDADLLDDTLPLVRALKPLLKKIESQLMSTVNEAETVDRIAETDIWSPVLDPDQEPWFEVALVIDGSPAMSLWQRLIQDIQQLLRCYGSFRDFRVWQLAVSHDGVGLCAASDNESVVRSPNALLAPDARRLILVFSDCTANFWWDGTLQPVLAQWGKSTPTTIWQVLPDWMWKRTALGVGEYVAVRNRIPGARNTRLTPVFLSLRSVARRSSPQSSQEIESDQVSLSPPPICIPVITSDGKSLQAWSQMLAGDRRYSSPGFVLPPTGWPSTADSEPEADDDAAVSDLADEQLENFRLRATPAARRLAALLSAAPVITLPVMRLIRASDELLPGSSPLPVAEVFLGGLLKKAPEQPDNASPELVQYTFPDEVRQRLLDVLPKVDAIEVIEAVSKHVADRLNCTLADFRALLLSPDLKDEADRYGLRSFAQMTAQILRRVGPEFKDLVDQLEGTPSRDDSSSESEPPDTDWLTGFTHQKLTYTVAEYLDFPPITDFDYTEAELVEEDDTFPPPLKPDDFKIVTIELQPAGPQLEAFEFSVATLVSRQDISEQIAQANSSDTPNPVPRPDSPPDFRPRPLPDPPPLPPGPDELTRRSFEGRVDEPSSDSDWLIQYSQRQANRCIEALPDDITLEIVSIPGGTFRMGSPEDEPERNEDRESPQHDVNVPPFFMGRYPITQAQWRVVAALPQVNRELNPDPSYFKGDNRPVENVSWHDAVEFCARLSAYTNRTYRLPSEAEWEYACRANTTTPFHFGDMITTDVANYNGSVYADGPQGESRGETTPVDRFGIANAFGLSDVHGNVLEWCADHWHENYENAPTDGSAWIEGGDSSRRVWRGGSWDDDPRLCRSAYRDRGVPDLIYNGLGFRVVCSPPRT